MALSGTSLVLAVGGLCTALSSAQALAPDDGAARGRLMPTASLVPQRPGGRLPSGGDPVVPGGGIAPPREGLAPGQRAQVIVELVDPPVALTLSLLQAMPWLPGAPVDDSVTRQREQVQAAQQALLAILTAPPFQATVIARIQLAMNAVVIEVDAGYVAQIQQLPGVKSVRIARIGTMSQPIRPTDDTHPSMPGQSVEPATQ